MTAVNAHRFFLVSDTTELKHDLPPLNSVHVCVCVFVFVSQQITFMFSLQMCLLFYLFY
jgi:hypothetical protein